MYGAIGAFAGGRGVGLVVMQMRTKLEQSKYVLVVVVMENVIAITS